MVLLRVLLIKKTPRVFNCIYIRPYYFYVRGVQGKGMLWAEAGREESLLHWMAALCLPLQASLATCCHRPGSEQSYCAHRCGLLFNRGTGSRDKGAINFPLNRGMSFCTFCMETKDTGCSWLCQVQKCDVGLTLVPGVIYAQWQASGVPVLG